MGEVKVADNDQGQALVDAINGEAMPHQVLAKGKPVKPAHNLVFRVWRTTFAMEIGLLKLQGGKMLEEEDKTKRPTLADFAGTAEERAKLVTYDTEYLYWT